MCGEIIDRYAPTSYLIKPLLHITAVTVTGKTFPRGSRTIFFLFVGERKARPIDTLRFEDDH